MSGKKKKTLSQLKRACVLYKRSFICTGRWEQFSVCKTSRAAKTKIPAFIIRDRSLARVANRIYVSQISSHLNLMVSKTSNTWLFFSESQLGLSRWRKKDGNFGVEITVMSCCSSVSRSILTSLDLSLTSSIFFLTTLCSHSSCMILLWTPFLCSMTAIFCSARVWWNKPINCNRVHHYFKKVMYIDGCEVSVLVLTLMILRRFSGLFLWYRSKWVSAGSAVSSVVGGSTCPCFRMIWTVESIRWQFLFLRRLQWIRRKIPNQSSQLSCVTSSY